MSLKLAVCVVLALLPLFAYGHHSQCEDKCKGRCVRNEPDCTGDERMYTGPFCRCHGSPNGSICCVKSGQCDMEPVCIDTCHSKSNGVCDDGGERSQNNNCRYKTDCHDCGQRKDKCELVYNGVCRQECLDHEFPRTGNDVCDGQSGCICCSPKCDVTLRPVNAKTKCERSAQGHCVTHPIDCDNFNVNDHAYNGSFADCNGDPQGRGVCCTDVDEGMEGLCDDTCTTARNGICEDGGPDSEADTCEYGTDYPDCPNRDEMCVRHHKGVCRRPTNGCGKNEVEVRQPPGLALGLCLGQGRGNRNGVCCRSLCHDDTNPGEGDGTGTPPPPNPDATRGPGDSEDPKFVTIDGNVFHYEGICTYTLLRECEYPSHRPLFVVYVEHTAERVVDSHGRLKTYVKGAFAEFDTKDGGKHKIHFKSHGLVKINDMPAIDMDVFQGWEDSSMGLRVKRVRQRLTITLDGYFTLSYNRQENVFVELDERMNGKVCGMMGNGDGNPDNDFQILDSSSPSGLRTLVNPSKEEIDMFGDSWVKPGSCPTN